MMRPTRLLLVLSLAGCGSSTGMGPGGPPPDAAAQPDLIPPRSGEVHALHAGAATGTMATVHAVALTGPPRNVGYSNTTFKCEYEAYVEDPLGGAAPDAVRLFAYGSPCTPGAGGACTCPAPPATGTPLDAMV